MTINNPISVMLDKCDIYYENALISKEDIIERYIQFFDNVFGSETHSVNFALHTGSICFDIISVVAITIGCLSYNTWTNEDIISQLQIGDMVMYESKRYWWKGLEEDNGLKYMVLGQDAKGKNGESIRKVSFKRYKHLVKPYYGTSSLTDGRGGRKPKTNREEFLSYIFDVPIVDVPSVINVAVVIVSNKGDFSEICKHLSIVYEGKKRIGLLDIVPAAYYTGQEEIQFGTNPTKATPVLKIAGKMSVARDIVLDKYGNKVVGLLVNGAHFLMENGSELADLLQRKSLRYVHITLLLNIDASDHILDMYEEANIFACTKGYLSKNTGEIKCVNSFTVELEKQIDNIVNNTVTSITVSGGWTWEEYSKIKNALVLIRQSNWINEQKNEFILSAHGLLNLLITSVFSMCRMEDAIKNLKIGTNVLSPKERIDKLWVIADKAGAMEELCIGVINDIEEKYYEFMDQSPKALAIKEYLAEHSGRKIAIVVPKAYYAEMLVLTDVLKDNDDVICVTANRFDATHEYESILVVGDISNKKFNPLQCHSAKNIDILLYECENKSFGYRRKKKDKSEKRLNSKIRGIKYNDENLEDVYAEKNDKEEEIIVQNFSDLEEYIEKLNVLDIRKFVEGGLASNSNSPTSEVKYVGMFVTGERIFFSKYYTAVVFDYEAGSVTEKAVDELLPGDFLVFTRRDDYTQNIVDFIYEKLLDTGKLSKKVIEASEKAVYWKDALRRYKTQGDYTYSDIAKKMRKAGSSLQDVAIRSWLVEDSHIVGPKNVKTMEYIAQITQDIKLLNDTDGYFEACRIVRSERKKILKLIGKAINNKLSGHIPQEGSVLEVVYNNVDNLSETLELEDIIELHESTNVNINLVNKPITEAEVLM
jgi:hypothetical protein